MKFTKTEKNETPPWAPSKGPIDDTLFAEAMDVGEQTGDPHYYGEIHVAVEAALKHVNKQLALRGYR